MSSEIISENGYVIIAVNPIEFRQAQCCAFSIKSKMPSASVTLVVPDSNKVERSFLEGFDAVADLPYKQHTTCRQNDWQLYWCSPYENTIAIDCKSLVKDDQTSMWDYLIDHYDIVFPDAVNDIRKNKINLKYQDNLESEYNLNVVYTNMFFFKKNEVSLRHFKLADVYFQYWKDACGKFLQPQHIPDFFDADVMHSLVATHTGDDVFAQHNVLQYIDMKNSVVSGALGKITKWTDKLNIWSSANGKIKIQNYAVNGTLSYHENEFLTDEIFNEQHNYYSNITK
jgi:hypothetical protein